MHNSQEGLQGKQPEGKELESKAENLLLPCDMANSLARCAPCSQSLTQLYDLDVCRLPSLPLRLLGQHVKNTN